MPHFIALIALVSALLIPLDAYAQILPVSAIEHVYFPTAVEGLQVLHARIEVVQASGRGSGGPEWQMDAEFTLRNHNASETEWPLAIIDVEEFTDDTRLWINGVPQETDEITLRQDPSMREHTYDHARGWTLMTDGGEIVTLRVTLGLEGDVDNYGQQILEIQTHSLGLFESPVESGSLRVVTSQRANAMRSTISGAVHYDEPENEITWYLREWIPTIPFQMSHLPGWSALLLVAEVEACPAPWDVVNQIASGDVVALRTWLQTFDIETLEFCANLPLVIHGFPFESDRAREQLAGIPYSRYLPGDERGSIYRMNEEFTEDMLSDTEAIYRRTLVQIVDAPVP